MDPLIEFPRQVSALFVREDSIYKQILGVDAWDANRDARLFKGPGPIIAHPPCRQWASLRHKAKPNPGEKRLALIAVDFVRRFGGVLEHPNQTTLWNVAGLPEPGNFDNCHGWTLIVDQSWFGHRAKKSTRLYIVGCAPSEIPVFEMRLGEASHTVGLWSNSATRNKHRRARPSISKDEFDRTPPLFAYWLVNLARNCLAR